MDKKKFIINYQNTYAKINKFSNLINKILLVFMKFK